MIETEDLTKHFDLLTAVDQLTLRVEPGEVLGFLGPNGAGKSTAMKMLTGFLAPSAGRAAIAGHDVGAAPLAARAALGYLPEGAPAYAEMVPRAFLRFIADMRGLRGARRRERLDWVTDWLHLGPVLQQPIATLSKGFKRRLGLAQALLHDPPVLILDEPTDGLDPNQKHEVRALIAAIAPEKTIVVSTHILEEVEAVCTRAMVIRGGRIAADETPAGLLARSRYRHAATVTFAEDCGAALPVLQALPGVLAVAATPDRHGVTVFGEDALDTADAIRRCCRERGWQPVSLRAEGGRLDDVFRAITMGAGQAA